jgi:hypothetical protein
MLFGILTSNNQETHIFSGQVLLSREQLNTSEIGNLLGENKIFTIDLSYKKRINNYKSTKD